MQELIGCASLHFMQELFCGVIGLGIFFMVKSLYKKRPELNMLFWFSMWGLYLGILTITHAIIGMLPNIRPEHFIPFTYLPERVGDSILALLCIYGGINLKKRFLGLTKKTWTISALILSYIGIVGFGLFAHKSSMLPGFFGRPQEIIQIIPAAFVFGRLYGAVSPFAKYLKWGTLATLLGGIIMLWSHNLFDIQFVWAHNFKIISYVIMFITTLWVRDVIREEKK